MDINQYEQIVINGLDCEYNDLKYNSLVVRTRQVLEHNYELIDILPIFLKHYRLLKPCHFGLIDLIFDRINWLKDDKVYEEFILKIISESSFTEICIYHLLKALKPQVIIDKEDPNLGKADLIKQLKFDYKLSVAIAKKVHELLKKILNFVPTAISLLLKLIDNLYPIPSSDTIYHSWYVKNLLQISNWCQITRKAVFSSIFSSLIKIDALDDVSEEEDERNNDQYAEDIEEEEESIDKSLSFNNSHKSESILLQIITHLDSMDASSFDDKYFFDLLFIFEEKIINSIHSRHSQYVLFYLCTKRLEHYPQKFMAYLLNKIIRTNSPTQYRISAMGCLSSFVVRFGKISPNLIVECFDLLIKWAIDYIEKNSSQNGFTSFQHLLNTPPDVTSHSIFYALCQSIIYIFIWKHNILTFEHNSQELQENFRKILIHPFNPLIVCKKRIVEEFIKITSRRNLCDDLENYYNELSNVMSHVKFDSKYHFHFDPLDDSKCFDVYISKHYNSWQDDIDDNYENSNDDNSNNMSNSFNSFNEPCSLIPKNESSLNFQIDANIDL